MRKIFRLAKAELGKIFMRPSMIMLTTILIFALVLSTFCFQPATQNNTKFTYKSDVVYKIYSEFNNDFNGDDGIIKRNLVSAKTNIDSYMAPENDVYLSFKNSIFSTYTAYNDCFNIVFNNYSRDVALARGQFKIFRAKVASAKNFIETRIEGENINFFIHISELNRIKGVLTNLLQTLPTDTQVADFNSQALLSRITLIKDNFANELASIKNFVFNSIETIDIDSSQLDELLGKYYTPNITETTDGYVINGTLKKLYADVENFYLENVNSTKDSDINTINEKIANLYDYIQMCKTLITNNFELLRIGPKTDDEIVTYTGFSGTSIYNLNLDIAKAKYFYDLNNDTDEKNNTFGYDYLNVFNFNVNSGTVTNCYDFTFFAMQILSSLIILFVIFFASSTISGEQNSGTLKMTAMRPYSRNKIYSGKFLACFNLALILMLVSFVSSFVVGVVSYGFSMQNVMVVMNANQVFITNPLVVMLIYFISLIIDLIFYIALAILISLLVKPTTINTAISASIFILSTIISGVIGQSWIRFIPTTHLGLFKFFTVSNTGLFSYSIVPGVNFAISGLIVLVSIVMFDLINRMLFARRSIDK